MQAPRSVIHPVRQSKHPAKLSRAKLTRLVKYVREMQCDGLGERVFVPGFHNPLCRKHALLNLLGVQA